MTPPRPSDALLPLKPLVFQVLLTLATDDQHGYAIVQDIARRTAARLRLRPGNLYHALKLMLDAGLIEESDRRPAPDLDDERRRYYRITRFGRRTAAAEAERLQALVADAKAARLFKART
jgi:DNA-binding PadR family transcriptional regulator